MAVIEEYFKKKAESAKASTSESITPLGKLARDEYLLPVRPGKLNETPFWNQSAHQFMYAPSFDFPEIEGASRYRFTVRSPFGQDYVFDADKPYATLEPIWLEISTGPVQLTVEALDSEGES